MSERVHRCKLISPYTAITTTTIITERYGGNTAAADDDDDGGGDDDGLCTAARWQCQPYSLNSIDV